MFEKSTTQYPTTDQINKNVEFSMQEMIKKISGVQGFFLCSCKTKFPCESRKYTCFKMICYVTVNVIINCHLKINNNKIIFFRLLNFNFQT